MRISFVRIGALIFFALVLGAYALTVTGVLPGTFRDTAGGAISSAEGASYHVAGVQEDQLDIWWPASGSLLTGEQPFKAMLKNVTAEGHTMYWQVEGGDLVPMATSYTDYPHKEALVDLSGWNWRGNGPYTVTFVAKDSHGSVIARRSVEIYTGADPAGNQAPAVEEPSSDPSAPPVTVRNVTGGTGNPFAGAKLYGEPYHAAQQAANDARGYDSYRAGLLDKLAHQPVATWLGGWNGDVAGDARRVMQNAQSQGGIPTFILYNIPARDCGGYSAGGTSAEGYRSWVRAVASGIGNGRAAVVLEPDALAGMDCLSGGDQATRLNLLREAVSILSANPGTSVYLDAGHAKWIAADEMASRLQRAGIDGARGFALNVSNYFTTDESIRYGEAVSARLGGKPFVVDTSRNGTGSNGEWCNPAGRALGTPPTAATGHGLVDAFLWLKRPGESDGTCSGGPSAGHFWLDYALGLAERANW